jgi:aspartyl-tRNA synthetase
MLLTNNISIKEVILFPSMKKIQPGEGGDAPSADADQH